MEEGWDFSFVLKRHVAFRINTEQHKHADQNQRQPWEGVLAWSLGEQLAHVHFANGREPVSWLE